MFRKKYLSLHRQFTSDGKGILQFGVSYENYIL